MYLKYICVLYCVRFLHNQQGIVNWVKAAFSETLADSILTDTGPCQVEPRNSIQQVNSLGQLCRTACFIHLCKNVSQQTLRCRDLTLAMIPASHVCREDVVVSGRKTNLMLDSGRMSATIVSEQEDLVLLKFHCSVESLKPFLYEDRGHPSLPVGTIHDWKGRPVNATKAPRILRLTDDKWLQLVARRRVCQHECAIKRFTVCSFMLMWDGIHIVFNVFQMLHKAVHCWLIDAYVGWCTYSCQYD